MPICTLHLLSLSSSISSFVSQLSSIQSEKPLVIARAVRWIITPSLDAHQTPLTTQQPLWDLLLIILGTDGLTSSLLEDKRIIQASYTLRAGIPSSLVKDFHSANQRLLHPNRSEVPALTGSLDRPLVAQSAQNLEFTPELESWIQRWDPSGQKGAVSMLNLLQFKEGMHSEYLKYGKAFAESIGSRRGGKAKLVGKVVPDSSSAKMQQQGAKEGEWDEIALAHYPSIRHFADMAASEDYQAVNQAHRVGSLADTCILCTSELDLELFPKRGSTRL